MDVAGAPIPPARPAGWTESGRRFWSRFPRGCGYPVGKDDDLVFAEVGDRVDRHVADGKNAPAEEEQRRDQHEKAVLERPANQAGMGSFFERWTISAAPHARAGPGVDRKVAVVTTRSPSGLKPRRISTRSSPRRPSWSQRAFMGAALDFHVGHGAAAGVEDGGTRGRQHRGRLELDPALGEQAMRQAMMLAPGAEVRIALRRDFRWLRHSSKFGIDECDRRAG